MKVKIISDSAIERLEKKINEFISTVDEIIDIKFARVDSYHSVLIMYKDFESQAD